MSGLSDLLQHLNNEGWSSRRIERETEKHGRRISYATVSRYLNGTHPQNPDSETLQAFADAFGVNVNELRATLGKPGVGEAFDLGPEASRLTGPQREAVRHVVRVMLEQNDALAGDAVENGATSGVSLSEMPIDPSLPQTGKHSWTPDMPTAELLPLVFDLVDEREHADHQLLREQAARQLDELLRHLAERRSDVAATDTDIGQKVQDRPRPDSTNSYPWEQPDFDLAAKRGRNRGREAREQQDRDAEDGGA